MEAVNPLKAKRDRVEVMIYTQNHRVEGEVHTQPGGRLTDFVNSRGDQSFIPVTNAKVYDMSGEKQLFTADFLAVNKNGISMIFPTTGLKSV